MKNNNNKTYHIITIGCQMNIADSERLATFLESRGFVATSDFKTAGAVIINTCGVRQAAENRVYTLADKIRAQNPAIKIVVIGCLSQREDVKRRLIGRADLFLPTSEMMRLPELLENIFRAEVSGAEVSGAGVPVFFRPRFSRDEVRLKQGEKYLKIKPKYEKDFSAYIPIGNGCNNFCSYCVVPYARGREVYRPATEIIKEARRLVKAGYKEIILIAQNVNSYKDPSGFILSEKQTGGHCKDGSKNRSKEGNIVIDFSELLRQVALIPGKFWVRFSSSHPKDLSDKLIKVIGESPKVCPHLHLAAQSGDNKILKAMNRKYTVGGYKKLIKKIRIARPGIAITTDVIVGFPGETRGQFQNTLKLFKELNFDLAYISQYSPRPETAAAKMKDNVSPEEKKRRAYVLNEALKETALAGNQKYLGQTIEVLVEGQNRYGKYLGRAGTYQTVLVEEKEASRLAGRNKKMSLIGKFVLVKIIRVKAFGLEGKLVIELL